MLRNVFGGCVSDRSADAMRYQKIKFGAPLSTTLKNNQLPIPLVELLRYIAAEGMNTADLFRRPGNPTDTRHVLKRLSEGKPVIYQNYNLYTLASVVKKFLLRLPDGIFGIEGEETLLQVLTLGHKMDQYKAVNDYINTLSQPHQQLVSLLFGIWFTMINNSDVNFMTTEALSRSVAGSIFHSCATDPAKVEKASRIMQILIENFGVASMFGQKNIEYFADVTHTKIHIREKFRYQFDYPADKMIPHCMLSPVGAAATKLFVLYLFQEAHDCCFDPVTDAVDEERFLEMTQLQTPREGVHEASESPDHTPDTCRKDFLSPHRDFDGDSTSSHLMAVSTISAPEVSLAPSPDVNNKRPKSVENNLNESSAESTQNKSLSRFNSVKRKQLERLRQRSDWFLRPSNSSTPMQLGSSYTHLSYEHDRLAPKISGNSVTKASSEGAALDILSSDDADSVFSNVSRSESPASEPIRTPPIKVTRDIIHSDPLGEATEEEDVPMEDDSTDHHHDVASGEDNLHDQEMHDAEICYFVVEHKYGDSQS